MLTDPQLETRNVLHTHDKIDGIDGPVKVPMMAVKFAHDGARIDPPPPRLGQHTEAVLMGFWLFE